MIGTQYNDFWAFCDVTQLPRQLFGLFGLSDYVIQLSGQLFGLKISG
jgi:hypothetical protein